MTVHRLDRPVALLLVLALLLPLGQFPIGVQAQGTDDTPAPEWVVSQYNVTFGNFSDITVKVRYDVYEADLGLSTGVPASTFRGRIASEPGVKQEFMDKARQELMGIVNGTLGSLDLGNATVQASPGYIVSLGQNITGDIYRDPVSFGADAHVTINPACLGLPAGTSVDRLVRGTLVMGGILNLSVELKAKAGHLNLFHVVPPAGFYFKAGQALTSTRELSIDARNSTVDLGDHSYLALVYSVPAKLKARIDAPATVDVQKLDQVTLSVDLAIYAVDSTKVSPHFPSILGIYLVSADGLRMAVEEGLLTWAEVQDLTVQPQINALQSQLSGMLAGPMTLRFEWNQTSLSGYDAGVMVGRPVRARLTGNGSLDLKGMSRHIAEQALWSGAKVPFEIGIYNDMNWSVQMTLPKNVTLEGTGLAPSSIVGGRGTYSWDRAFSPLKGSLAMDSTWEPSINGTIDVKLEIVNVDYDLMKVLGQHRTAFKFKVSVNLALESMPLDDEIQSSLPADVKLERANADLIRALIAEKKLDRARIDSLVEDLSRAMKLQLGYALGKEVDFRVLVDEHTLNASAMGAIYLRGSATVTVDKDLNAKDSLGSLIDTAKTFHLQGQAGWMVIYRITMPDGVEIYEVHRSLKASDFKTQPAITKDKRTMVEILENDLDDNVTLFVRPTVEKSIAVALSQPVCFLPIILVVVAIVCIAYYWRGRRARAREKARTERGRRAQSARQHMEARHERGKATTLDKDGQNLEGYRKLQPHVHQHRLPLRQWKSEGSEEEVPAPLPPRRAPPRQTPRSLAMAPMEPRAEVPLARPKPYLPPKPEAPARPRHITGPSERFVTCPGCKRRFSTHPEAEVLECPHCGKKGKAPPKKPHIIGAQPATRTIKCPRCGSMITYGDGQETIRCSGCGKEGRVKKKA